MGFNEEERDTGISLFDYKARTPRAPLLPPYIVTLFWGVLGIPTPFRVGFLLLNLLVTTLLFTAFIQFKTIEGFGSKIEFNLWIPRYTRDELSLLRQFNFYVHSFLGLVVWDGNYFCLCQSNWTEEAKDLWGASEMWKLLGRYYQPLHLWLN